MQRILQLKDFFLRKLSVEWQQGETAKTLHYDINVDYEAEDDGEDAGGFSLRIEIKPNARSEKASAYKIEAIIDGLFDLPKAWTEDQKRTMLRVNGGTILYGILRGHIANVTGSFRGSKLCLPTVDFGRIVAAVQEREARDALAGGTRPAKGKAAARKKVPKRTVVPRAHQAKTRVSRKKAR